ncbi:MAG: hypothetical protein GX964_04800 [Syntrophomonadaceae bacterium]|nr:hypothetical protein [Syntrophomonadaceae bacterium]
MSNRYKQVEQCLIIALFIFIITMVFTSLALAVRDGERIPPGLSVAGIPLGGLSYQEAQERLKTALPDQLGRHLVFRRGELFGYISCDDYQICFDMDGSLNRCVGGNQTGLKGLLFHSMVRGGARDVSPVISYDPGCIPEIMAAIGPTFNQPAQDARVIWKDDSLEYIPHKPGCLLDLDKTAGLLQQALNAGSLGPVTVAVRELSPRVKLNDVESVKDLLAVYVTSFDPAQEARTANMRLAVRAVNGTVVMPGQVFSLDELLGPRREEDGYQKAPVFVNKRVVEGVGGGICQVATTLYNAVLQADLKIVERWPHSLPITYAPPGQDATIAANVLDFKFQNHTEFPILLAMSMEGDELVVRIFGCQMEPDKKVQVVTERKEIAPRIIVRHDPRLGEGERVVKQKGKSGHLIRTYRVVSKGGQELEKTLLSEDYYRATDTIVMVGANASQVK